MAVLIQGNPFCAPRINFVYMAKYLRYSDQKVHLFSGWIDNWIKCVKLTFTQALKRPNLELGQHPTLPKKICFTKKKGI